MQTNFFPARPFTATSNKDSDLIVNPRKVLSVALRQTANGSYERGGEWEGTDEIAARDGQADNDLRLWGVHPRSQVHSVGTSAQARLYAAQMVRKESRKGMRNRRLREVQINLSNAADWIFVRTELNLDIKVLTKRIAKLQRNYLRKIDVANPTTQHQIDQIALKAKWEARIEKAKARIEKITYALKQLKIIGL